MEAFGGRRRDHPPALQLSHTACRSVDERWQLDGDALDGCGLRIAVQRLAASHWRPSGVLRSWGLAPLFRDGDTLCVPCADDEALWLGAWPEPAGPGGTLSLTDPASGLGASISVPAQQTITALGGQQPIARPTDVTARTLQLVMALQTHSPVTITISLVLMAPAAWSARAGRSWTALAGPPPLPPRLG